MMVRIFVLISFLSFSFFDVGFVFSQSLDSEAKETVLLEELPSDNSTEAIETEEAEEERISLDLKGIDITEVFSVIRSQNRSLEVPEERFWQMGYGSRAIHLLFNLWYRSFTHTPAYENNLPQVDHIFPQSALKGIRVINPETGRWVMKYDASIRNQLANCMLLSREENGAGGKSDVLPIIILTFGFI